MQTNVSYFERLGSLAGPIINKSKRVIIDLTEDTPPVSPRVGDDDDEVVPETPPRKRPVRNLSPEAVNDVIQEVDNLRRAMDEFEREFGHRDHSQPEEKKVEIPPTPEHKQEGAPAIVMPPPPQPKARPAVRVYPLGSRGDLMRRLIHQKQQRLVGELIKAAPKKKRRTADVEVASQPRRSSRVPSHVTSINPVPSGGHRFPLRR